MRKRIALTIPLLLLVTSYCHAQVLTLAQADAIILALLMVVFILLVLVGFGLYYNRVVSRRNEQLSEYSMRWMTIGPLWPKGHCRLMSRKR